MKRFFLVAAATLALCAPALAQSNYPSKPVKLIVDSAPGSATDVINRLVSERLAQIWGQQVLTLNYPGAGGSIAVRAASQAEPDGTTFFVGNASVFMALKGEPGVAPSLPVELPRDFTPIGFIAQQPMFIAVAPQTGINRCLS
jgi:tripartite-type tricarboxylate transporter receptor subunit TctC